ncbi:piggyBac transposable element-derived protein 3-like [Sitodiplosis mosellana]|uniref:piggyBac transposable element-derived protein 3-like n=1 Tax=Sitodiplosis mosellana TaxID=263140 RepID=UPI00244440F7|nr:piggyBac transposable element-derived protein 3-like [Sitodiplosis mosellana]
MSRKFTLKEAVDYLEKLIDEEEGDDFMQDFDEIYIEPPDEDGKIVLPFQFFLNRISMIAVIYNTVSNIKAYWNSADDLRNEMISQTMRRNRFQEILRVLHFEPNLHPPENNKDKLWKLRPMMDHLKANFLKHFHPTQHLSYDESMIAYFGKHGCKQFIKGKPIRFGYKVWSLCTPSGYLVNFEVYQGSNPRSNPKYEERFGKAAAPLLSMIDDFPEYLKGLPFSFFFDNLFTSFPMLAYLKASGYNGTGTMRQNRIVASCPVTKKKAFKKKPRGTIEAVKMQETGIRVTQWVDNSVVSIASTCFGSLPTSTAARYSKDAGKK